MTKQDVGTSARKIDRLRKALSHQEPDRVPVGEFFWTGFMNKCLEKWGKDFDPYRYFDLDYIVINPNMDPKIQPFEVIRSEGEDTVVKTGFGATIRRSDDLPVPHYEAVSVNEPEQMAEFQFDAPDDPRRFFSGGDDQINGVGDALHFNIPSWEDRLADFVNRIGRFMLQLAQAQIQAGKGRLSGMYIWGDGRRM
jgi:hypothetical protein